MSELRFLSEPSSPRDRPGHHKCSKTTRGVFKNELGPNSEKVRPRRAPEVPLGEVLGPCWAPEGTSERPKEQKSLQKRGSEKQFKKKTLKVDFLSHLGNLQPTKNPPRTHRRRCPEGVVDCKFARIGNSLHVILNTAYPCGGRRIQLPCGPSPPPCLFAHSGRLGLQA